MKLFTEASGLFQMFIPLEWEYKNLGLYEKDAAPHAFAGQNHEVGAFQLSCKKITSHILSLIVSNSLSVQNSQTPKLEFLEKIISDHKTVNPSYAWMCAVEDHFVLATYIFEKKNLSPKTISSEISRAKKSLATFKFVKPEFRDIVLKEERLRKFMTSMAAIIDLRNKAMEKDSFIELVILLASRIDGLLRLGLILQYQIDNSNDEINVSLLYQAKTDKAIMERRIYKMAFEKKIISQNLFNELENLYLERNKVVHRYIITDIRTVDVLKIAKTYFDVENKIDVIINDLEKVQFERNIG